MMHIWIYVRMRDKKKINEQKKHICLKIVEKSE